MSMFKFEHRSRSCVYLMTY